MTISGEYVLLGDMALGCHLTEDLVSVDPSLSLRCLVHVCGSSEPAIPLRILLNSRCEFGGTHDLSDQTQDLKGLPSGIDGFRTEPERLTQNCCNVLLLLRD